MTHNNKINEWINQQQIDQQQKLMSELINSKLINNKINEWINQQQIDQQQN
jgi:hypothetical protein